MEGDYQILTYLNLGASFLCVDDGTGLYTCQKVLVDAEENFLGITPSTSRACGAAIKPMVPMPQ